MLHTSGMVHASLGLGLDLDPFFGFAVSASFNGVFGQPNLPIPLAVAIPSSLKLFVCLSTYSWRQADGPGHVQLFKWLT
jgi:hypothetical protein